ncbi:D-Ala-D-Ala carboxypeptidase family metallohydrolase [Kocuria arenosa]|uniref:D-Ala-D-Ala carboxypeptidase family metallohydrolase n=1 Tax=Kocuria arenosa TaxID=3071446 RepID=UPI0034D72A78
MTTTLERQKQLRELGWDNVQVDGAWGKITQQAITDFQRGFAFWGLLMDGVPGPSTDAALSHAVDEGGRAAPNFRFEEFRCKGPISDSGCRRIWVNRDLVLALEQYRILLNGPVSITSGCRCSVHNTRVGGATSSQHLYGAACDVPPSLTVPPIRDLGLFSGFGTKNTLALHLDMRHLSGNNTTGGTPKDPTVWTY